jgi:arginase family enzyme
MKDESDGKPDIHPSSFILHPSKALSPTVRLLDLDGSVAGQERLRAYLGDRLQVVDLRALGPSVRYLATRGAMRRLAAALDPAERDRLTFTGSGDFHHVTAALLRQFTEPLSLVVFDTHPDWDRTSPWPCCGSWVLETLKQPNVRKVVIVGLGRVDLEGWHINVGRIDALRSERVAFYPYDCNVSRAFGRRTGRVHCASFAPRGIGSEIRWHRVVDHPWESLIGDIITRLPTNRVYLSVDKDCLDDEAARTNWEAGRLGLTQLLQGIRQLAREKEIVGADITGEYSPVAIRSPWFRALSAWDHPAQPTPAAEELQRNEGTNLALLSALGY